MHSNNKRLLNILNTIYEKHEILFPTNKKQKTTEKKQAVQQPAEVPLIKVKATHNAFRLIDQPEEWQRKAYRNENRYIMPNPLVVHQIPSINANLITDCTASVRVLYANGELPTEDSRNPLLVGATTKVMIGKTGEKKALFSLKLRETSGKSKFKLCFTITYKKEGTWYEESIVSSSFRAVANFKKSAARTLRPLLLDSMPKKMNCNQEDKQVWIRGSHFADRGSMMVYFGDHPATILDVDENIIVCIAPALHVHTDTVVQISVATIHSERETLICNQTLPFTFLAPPNQLHQLSLPISATPQQVPLLTALGDSGDLLCFLPDMVAHLGNERLLDLSSCEGFFDDNVGVTQRLRENSLVHEREMFTKRLTFSMGAQQPTTYFNSLNKIL